MPCFLFNNITGGERSAELPPKPGLGCACKRQSPVSWLPVPSGPGQRSRSRDATLPPLPRDPGPHLADSGEEAVAGPGWRSAGEAIFLSFWPDYTSTDPHPCLRRVTFQYSAGSPTVAAALSHFGNYLPLGKAALPLRCACEHFWQGRAPDPECLFSLASNKVWGPTRCSISSS